MGGPQQIKMSEIVAYLDLVGEMCPEERPRFMRLMQLLDSVYMEYEINRSKTESK